MAGEPRRPRAGLRTRSLAPRTAVKAKQSRPGPQGEQSYLLRLYVTGLTPNSRLAIENVRSVCDKHLRGRYTLEVIDIYQMPALARNEQIVATPTLIKVLPPPLRRFIGNLSKTERVLFGLDLRERSDGQAPA